MFLPMLGGNVLLISKANVLFRTYRRPNNSKVMNSKGWLGVTTSLLSKDSACHDRERVSNLTGSIDLKVLCLFLTEHCPNTASPRTVLAKVV